MVTLQAPLGGERLAVPGRISQVRPPSRIEVRLDQPWRGRLRVRFDADGTGTGSGSSPNWTTPGWPG